MGHITELYGPYNFPKAYVSRLLCFFIMVRWLIFSYPAAMIVEMMKSAGARMRNLTM